MLCTKANQLIEKVQHKTMWKHFWHYLSCKGCASYRIEAYNLLLLLSIDSLSVNQLVIVYFIMNNQLHPCIRKTSLWESLITQWRHTRCGN